MAQPAPNAEEGVEKLVEEYQSVQEQLRSFAALLNQLQNQKEEIERAKQEIQASSGKIYLNVGGIMVETTKEKALSDLDNRDEMLRLRITSSTKQYNELKEKEKKLAEQLTQLYKSQD